ncbi:trafficking protein particle complex subunit 6B [Cordyceps militaris CM01]|uniref:Trafficking protein particle complex subunit 6B n=1 Tax=Cordyceps militaris (strain CM01) TaxID=983644 RepID=G3JH69_CORMM|nr:trafficking protein particle complex subunit 6B [Cordyceps militaris CM01]EGX91625.1 trafficking protein particle complex subunit 6B [Cordyceps militaris CM01]
MSLEPVMPPYNASDPSASFLSSSCLDFLLIELVPLAYRVTQERDGDAARLAEEKKSTRSATADDDDDDALPDADEPPQRASSTAAGSTGHPRRFDDEDEELDAVHYRLESQGYRVGQGLVERFSRDRPRLNDTLDVIKFLCKDLWSLVFGKNIDNLKTNHRGVYVLTDNVFRPFSRMSTVAGGQAVVRAQPFLWFPCGIVRGALAALGINASVQAEINELPGAVFQIKTLPVKT